jgi:hypothetical protein
MDIDILFPSGVQMQSVVDKPVQHEPRGRVVQMKIAPVVTTQTVTSTKAALPASPLASRNRMVVRNLDPVRTIRIGQESAVTEKVGLIVEPLEELTIEFDTSTAVPIWAVATGAEVRVEVIES